MTLFISFLLLSPHFHFRSSHPMSLCVDSRWVCLKMLNTCHQNISLRTIYRGNTSSFNHHQVSFLMVLPCILETTAIPKVRRSSPCSTCSISGDRFPELLALSIALAGWRQGSKMVEAGSVSYSHHDWLRTN